MKGVDFMNYMITGKNLPLTDALKDIVQKKMGKLEKYFNPDTEIHITLSVQKSIHKIEVTIPTNGRILRGEVSTEDMYLAIDSVIEKLERQIIKNKSRLERKTIGETLRYSNIPESAETDNELKIVKTKKFAIKPMDAEEAVLQMDLLGHNFFVFRDASTDEVNVVYKRRDGNYGLIEPEF